MSILPVQDLEVLRGPLARQAAEHDEVVAGHDLGLHFGTGLLPTLQPNLLDFFIALLG